MFDGDGHKIEWDDAKEIVEDMRKQVLKKALGIFAGHIQHVPQSHRKSPTKKDLIYWLQCNNEKRNYIFYSSTGLKALISKRGIKLCGKKTIDLMQDALAGENDDAASQQGQNDVVLSPKLAATMSILQKSFLPHRKGVHCEYASLGHCLEKPILKNWMYAMKDLHSPVIGLKVYGGYTAGLAAKKGKSYAKDSIDFILVVGDPSDAEDGEALKVWGFEAKGRVTSRTAADKEVNLRYQLQPHICIADNHPHKSKQCHQW